MPTSLRAIRITCAVAFAASIAGMIISSIAGNNNGVVTTAGMIGVTGAIVLLTASSVASKRRIDAFDDAAAEQLEYEITKLAQLGTDESALRKLVRDATRLGRSAS